MTEYISLIVKFISVFSLIWWIVFLMIIPIKVTISDKRELGHASSAPDDPKIKLKIIITTIITLIITLILFYLIRNDIIDLYELLN